MAIFNSYVKLPEGTPLKKMFPPGKPPKAPVFLVEPSSNVWPKHEGMAFNYTHSKYNAHDKRMFQIF